MGGQTAHIREIGNTHKILAWKSEGTRPCGRPRYILEGSSKMDLK